MVTFVRTLTSISFDSSSMKSMIYSITFLSFLTSTNDKIRKLTYLISNGISLNVHELLIVDAETLSQGFKVVVKPFVGDLGYAILNSILINTLILNHFKLLFDSLELH